MMPYRTAVPIIGSCAVADPGEGPEETPPPPSLTLGPNWEPKSRKMCFKTAPPPPYLRVWMNPPPRPCLKVSIHHCCVQLWEFTYLFFPIFLVLSASLYMIVYVLYIFVDAFLIFSSISLVFFLSSFYVVRHFRLSLLNNFYCDILHLNICKPEEGWYGQPKYCYKKQYTLF